jgi:hypothetical protein
MKKRLALEWVLGKPMLAEPSDLDYEPVDEIWFVLILGMMRSPSLIHVLVLLPRKIRVVLQPMIVVLKIGYARLLPKVIENIHLLH